MLDKNDSSVSQIPIPGFKEPVLWKHQSEAVVRARSQRHLALFFEVGTGKTLTAIKILRERCTENNRYMRTLIFCPKIVIENWRREILKFSKIPESQILCLRGGIPGKKRSALLRSFTGSIVIVNYQAALEKQMPELFDALMDFKPEVLIADESHKLKDGTSKTTKGVIKITKACEHRYILSGTPMLNDYMDYFSQLFVMDRGQTLGNDFFAFRGKYFYDLNAGMPKDKYFPNWAPLPESEKFLIARLGTSSCYAEKSKCLDLPPYIKKTVFVEMSPEQKRMYDEMREDFVATINDEFCAADLAITKALRLQQIVSGHVPVENMDKNKRVERFEKNPRAEALEELLVDLSPKHKIIVWAVYKEDYGVIEKVLKDNDIDFVSLTGQTKEADRQKFVDRFNTDKKCRVLYGHPDAGGIGVNLIASNVSIYYSRNFRLDFNLQSEARNFRGGSEIHDSITRIDIVCSGTIDEVVLEALNRKEKMGLNILRSMKGNL